MTVCVCHIKANFKSKLQGELFVSIPLSASLLTSQLAFIRFSHVPLDWVTHTWQFYPLLYPSCCVYILPVSIQNKPISLFFSHASTSIMSKMRLLADAWQRGSSQLCRWISDGLSDVLCVFHADRTDMMLPLRNTGPLKASSHTRVIWVFFFFLVEGQSCGSQWGWLPRILTMRPSCREVGMLTLVFAFHSFIYTGWAELSLRKRVSESMGSWVRSKSGKKQSEKWHSSRYILFLKRLTKCVMAKYRTAKKSSCSLKKRKKTSDPEVKRNESWLHHNLATP